MKAIPLLFLGPVLLLAYRQEERIADADSMRSRPKVGIPEVGIEMRVAIDVYKEATRMRKLKHLCLSGAYWSDREFNSLSKNPWTVCWSGYDLNHSKGTWHYSEAAPTPCSKDRASSNPVFQIGGAKKQPFELRFLGALAKGGDFLRTQNRRVLVKRIHGYEMTLLEHIMKDGEIMNHYGGCKTFAKSLFVPTPLTFRGSDHHAYVVMVNETQAVEMALGPGWRVTSGLDMKPLPNIPRDLDALLEHMEESWKGGRGVLKHWKGWKQVRKMMTKDLTLLEMYDIVDHSAFIHVAKRTSGGPSTLGPAQGCITKRDGQAVVCIKIIDYLTLKTNLRKVESFMKGDKFWKYNDKFETMFDCLGDLSAEGCETYRDFGLLMTANADAESSVMVRSSLFRENYECTMEVPSEDTGPYAKPDPAAKASGSEIDRGIMASSKHNKLAFVPLMSSNGKKVGYNGKGFSSKLARLIQGALKDAQPARETFQDTLPTTKPVCAQVIRKFSGKWKQGDIISSNGNTWITRRMPKTGTLASLAREIKDGGCDLGLRLFRCRPEGNHKVKTTYAKSFHGYEVMQLFNANI